MAATESSRWVVLKFGGTSVSALSSWQQIAKVVQARLDEGLRPVVVLSALSGVSDWLTTLLSQAVVGEQRRVLADIDHRHRDLARELSLTVGSGLERHLADLSAAADEIANARAVTEPLRARVMATGALLVSELGRDYLQARGLEAALVDARTVLASDRQRAVTERLSVLAAVCTYDADPELARRLTGLGRVIVTQGAIARDELGGTVLLGRGGADTSAAYFAAKLDAARLEIWSDVPGLFTADPKIVPHARLLRALDYDEAQEITSSGGRVFHPRCIVPLRQARIPLHVYATPAPEVGGTVVSSWTGDNAAQVKSICVKQGITLVSMESAGMWQQVGFLADAFLRFKNHGLSVNLVSTSETNVTVSLDPAANLLDAHLVTALLDDLSPICRAESIGPCASLSLVGRNIRGILHKLGEALKVFEEQRIYLVSQAANDLNFTFVIDEAQSAPLVSRLHDALISAGSSQVLGPTWQELYGPSR